MLAANLRRRAKQKGVALYVIAETADVSRSMIYDIVKGRVAPTIKVLERLARALDCEAWELLKP